jgi:hypothetical protein
MDDTSRPAGAPREHDTHQRHAMAPGLVGQTIERAGGCKQDASDACRRQASVGGLWIIGIGLARLGDRQPPVPYHRKRRLPALHRAPPSRTVGTVGSTRMQHAKEQSAILLVADLFTYRRDSGSDIPIMQYFEFWKPEQHGFRKIVLLAYDANPSMFSQHLAH